MKKDELIGKKYSKELQERIEKSGLEIDAVLINTNGVIQDTISTKNCEIGLGKLNELGGLTQK